MSHLRKDIQIYLGQEQQKACRKPARSQWLSDSGYRITYLENVVNDVQLDSSLSSNAVVHSAGIELHQDDAAANNNCSLEQISFVARQ
jgi:hypothetical protein